MRLLVLLVVLLCIVGFQSCNQKREPARILVFTKTEGFRHNSIPAGIELFKKLGRKHKIEVEASEDASVFNEKNLQRFDAVVFLSTTGDILDQYQQADFERFIQAGGGFMGIHAAADTEYDWPWYGKLVGGYFKSHPSGTPTAMIDVLDKSHPSTDSLPGRWERTDEWYNYYNLNPDVNVLATLDESTYEGGENGDFHPTAWYHEYDGGRAFYTGGGHTSEAFSEPLFVKHLEGGLQWILDGTDGLNYKQVRSQRVPEENRFTISILESNLNEPTEFEVLDDFRVIFTERRGNIRMYDPAEKKTSVIATLNVYSEQEDGVMGMALDPDFKNNNWVYIYYSPAGSEPKQSLSRFKFTGDTLDLSTEQVILEVPTQRDECCHTGGSIEFDAEGNLYLSVGDDTNPFASSGYAPLDEREGRKPWDAQRTSGNANDLRGAILRIKVNEDGSYTIPEGNLFAEGTEGTRPEIYVMGNRNPYRISIDQKEGILYWGEVGPDSGQDSVGYGPKGHDEINQAKEAGFFGWPYFIGDNKAYYDYDFVTGQSSGQFDANNPLNNSPNNTGVKNLPPARKAFIWYPYGESKEFPLVGTGGRSAMAGPVYYEDLYQSSDYKFPDYFDGKLFIYEWMRGWIHVVTLDEDERYSSMNRFMPSHKFANPIDLQFAKDGSLYVLEYGTTWNQQNEDARILRIEFNGGNRKPILVTSVDEKAGAAPHTVNFSTEGTIDYDYDDLSFEWDFDGENGSSEANPTFEYVEPGIYSPRVTVTDSYGNKSSQKLEVIVGNSAPNLKIEVAGNNSFYWDDQEIEYVVSVSDQEDGSIGSGIKDSDILVTYHYLQMGYDETEIATGHKAPSRFLRGKGLLEASDCMACHQIETQSIGPSYIKVAERYKDDENAIAYLSGKIINGGGGVWGDQAMAAHPQLTQDDAEEIVKYILSIGTEKVNLLPTSGVVNSNQHLNDKVKGKYYLTASYTDKGVGDIPSISASETIVLNYYQYPAYSADVEKGEKMDYGGYQFILAGNGTKILLKDIDLSLIGSLSINGFVPASGCGIEVRFNDEKIGEGQFSSTGVPGPEGNFFFGQGNIPIDAKSQRGTVEILVSSNPNENAAISLINFNKTESL